MPAPRPFALIRTNDQWLRVSHDHTALEGEVVRLFWHDEEDPGQAKPFSETAAGLAFDGHCRLYHSIPQDGRVERILWAAQDPLQPADSQPAPVDVFATDVDEQLGDFSPAQPESTSVFAPRALAVDEDERLFVADTATRRILIHDLWSHRLLRQVQLAADPVDLVADGRRVYVLLAAPPGLIALDARSSFQVLALPPEITTPARIAISPQRELYVLEHAGEAGARVIKFSDPAYSIEVTFATELDFQLNDPTLTHVCAGADSVTVIARRPGEYFVRYCVGEKAPVNLRPLTARGYDGLGILRTPDGQIGFWTTHGFRNAVAARLRYFPNGSVTTFALDGGEFQTIWGRLFLDACIPKDTGITVRCITADELPNEELPRPDPPANTDQKPPHPEDSPPLPPPILMRQLKAAPAQSLHRREMGYELPWVRREEDDSFETYEAPVMAGAGRYLWVLIELSGNTRGTPRVRALRAEHPTHDYLRRLPQTLSRNELVAGFLRRYLAMFEGQLGDFEGKADARAILLDPRSAPAEILPWLASFVGLLLDERMARAPRPGGKIEDVRRTLIAEAIWLFRFRGTVQGLRRFVEIYLEIETILIEKFRVRGLGGAFLPDSNGVTTNSILGAGFRVGGAVGEDETQLLGGTIDDAFETHAHRFSLIIPASLSSEQRDVVNQILELHRPAHTLVDVCTVAAGMRLGRGLHVELTSIIGRSGGFSQLQLGGTTLGRGSILGRPEPGTVIGGSRLGGDSRIG